MADDLDQAFGRIAQLAQGRRLPEVTRSTGHGAPSLKLRDKTLAQLKDPGTLLQYHRDTEPPPSGANRPVEIEADLREVEKHLGR